MPHRPWTRLGVLATAGHLAYELLSGVGVPMASRVGVVPATTAYTVATAAAYRAAGRLPPPHGDRRFAVANGLFASAVVTHFTSWPRTTRAGLPWLTECEGMAGRVIGPYNALLYLSAVAAVGGAAENRQAWRWFVLTPLVALPLLRRETPIEYRRLLAQAADRPRWWNRRLHRATSTLGDADTERTNSTCVTTSPTVSATGSPACVGPEMREDA